MPPVTDQPPLTVIAVKMDFSLTSQLARVSVHKEDIKTPNQAPVTVIHSDPIGARLKISHLSNFSM